MKKAVKCLGGLVAGVVLSFAASGCYVYEANEEVNKIRAHHNAVKKIIGADPNDSYHVFKPKKRGEPLRVVIIKENGIVETLKYVDVNGDGIYERKVPLPKITIPDKLDIKVFPPPEKPKTEPGPKKYVPKKGKERLAYLIE